jgi:hypothetical protein
MGSFNEKHDQVYLLNWVVVRNYDEFVKIIIEKGMPEMISFDHDLADEHYDFNKPYGDYKEKTGFHCAKWLINYCIDNKMELPAVILIHSANPAGSANIKSLFDTYQKYLRI